MRESIFESDYRANRKDGETFYDYLRGRMIAVDTEYQTTEKVSPESFIERYTGIHKVFCAAFASSNSEWVVWIDPTKPDSYKNILADAAERLGIPDPIFVNFAFEAEWEAFHRLGDTPERYPWLDCYLLYRLKTNIQGKEGKQYKEKRDLVHAVDDMLGVKRDTAEKEAMRNLCIADQTEGHEQEIMEYCLEDVHDLIPLAIALLTRLESRFKNPIATKMFTPAIKKAERSEKWDTFFSQIMMLMDAAKAFAAISHRGIPVNLDRIDAAHKGATKVQDKLVRDFVELYPNTWRFESVEDASKTLHKYGAEVVESSINLSLEEFKANLFEYIDNRPKPLSSKTRKTIDTQAEKAFEIKTIKGVDGLWHRDDEACRNMLKDCLVKRGILDTWERTDKGKLSMASDVLEDEFKDETGNFGADYYRLCKAYNTLNGIAKDGEKSWLTNLDRTDSIMRYRSLRPFTAATGRCQPQTSKGFIFGWYKALYGVIEPPEGKWLVELDFSAEETLIQARVFDDPRYDEIYQSKDMYLWMGVQLGMIPRSDFESMTKSELKHKYKETRDRLKTYTLALGYGAGDKKLASKVKLPLEKIKRMKERTKRDIFPKSTEVRDMLQKGILTLNKERRTRCFWLQSGWHTVMPHDIKDFSPNAPLNFPIQGSGAAILHKLVVELEKAGIETLATIHDAIFFMVDEDDWERIALAKELMRKTANDYLGCSDHGIKVGDPEIIKHGEVWTPEHAYDDDAKEVLRAGGYAC